MDKKITKDEVIANKKAAIKELNNMMEYYLSKDDQKHLKKVNILSFWVKEFSKYILSEERFDSHRLLNYSRGDVIRANFGFKVGKEFGGLHYAVVLDNNSTHNSQVITVVPLSSTDGREKIHENSVDLGKELYEKIRNVQTKLLSETFSLFDEVKHLNDAYNTLSEFCADIPIATLPTEFSEKIKLLEQSRKELAEKEAELTKRLNILERNETEIENMKQGSMAVTNQITTISKQRIYTPKKSTDFLYGVSLSSTAMDKINEKLSTLFMFKN